MGKIAGEFCGEIILTNEDPYDEEPAQILKEIKLGIEKTKFQVSEALEILDRKEALGMALKRAQQGDTVVVSGKGSEPFIHVAHGGKIPWSDREVVKDLLGR